MKERIKKNKIFSSCKTQVSASGFVILFAVVVAGILLSITLGITNIALKELKFSTSAKETNEAFFAADTGIECALMNDKGATPAFDVSDTGLNVTCGGVTINPDYTIPFSNAGLYSFTINSLGSNNSSCAKVTVLKDDSTLPLGVFTEITSKGYNIDNGSCTSTSVNLVERQLETTYK